MCKAAWYDAPETEVAMDVSDIRNAFEERGIRKVKVGGFDVDMLLAAPVFTTGLTWGR